MTSFISKIDLFGRGFEFSTFKNSKFKTVGGGILTLFTLITILVFVFLFGNDFFYKMNPKVLSQIVSPDEIPEPILLSNQNMMIVWRMLKRAGSVFNHTGIIYPYFNHYEIIYNSTGTFYTTTPIESIKCSEVKAENVFFQQNINLEEYYCLNWEGKNKTFGGSSGTPFLNYFAMSFNACPGLTFSSENCTSKETLQTSYGSQNGVLMEIQYPEYHFSPHSLDDPMKMSYKQYLYFLNFNLRKRDRIYFKNATLIDDQGWILKDTKITNKITISNLEPEYYIFNEEDYGKPNVSSILYSMIFYLDKKYDMIERSYMKFQDLAAIVGGFSKIALMFGGVIAQLFYSFIRNNLIYNEFFEYKNEPEIGEKG